VGLEADSMTRELKIHPLFLRHKVYKFLDMGGYMI
jgi:hypothetical protein